jgi:hypothetical protein
MKLLFFLAGALLCSVKLNAQELYVATEPASNMARHSVGLRIMNEGMFYPDFKNRTNAEVMFGANKNLMLHASAYISDFYQDAQHFEGFSFYGKYKFLNIDHIQKHFRAASFIRYSAIKNPLVNDEINLEGDNTGMQAGLVVTQLLHKLALSASVSYSKAFDNGNTYPLVPGQADKSIGYTFSSGYLLLPKTYTDYKQTNLNFYLEFLGKSNPETDQNLMDIAPAIQFIFNSKLRVDLSQRTQLWGNMDRATKNMYLIRAEYNLFNVF